MVNRRLLLLGGYGNTGRPLARLLLQESDVQLVIAGRNLAKAQAFAQELNQAAGGERVRGCAADASDAASLKAAFQGIDLVVVVSSTARYARLVAETALENGIDYLDVQYSTSKIAILQSIAGQIEQAGRCFITDGGFHPGLPAVLIHYAAQEFDSLEKAVVGSVIKEDWASLDLPDETIIELIEEINSFAALVFRQGQWKKASTLEMLSYRSLDFGPPFGRQPCAAMFLEEMRPLPARYPTLQETGFYVGGFNTFVDWFVLPLAMVSLRISPQRLLKPLVRLMRWGLNTYSKPPFGIRMKLEAQGLSGGQPKALEIRLVHQDGYMFTALPVAACLLQYLDGSIRKPGLWTQANLVDPRRLMNDLARLGVEIQMIYNTIQPT